MISLDIRQQNLIPCECGCGELIEAVNKWGYYKIFKLGHNNRLREYKKGVDHHCWKGGRSLSPSGYIMVYAPTHPKRNSKNRVKEHRLVWEREHKACLLPWGDVHHTNGVKDDNRPENLEAMTHSAHRRLEQLIDMSGRVCLTCGGMETYLDKTNRPIWFNFLDGFECAWCHRHRYYLEKKK